MPYNLEQLGPTGFQSLAAALAVAELGAGVQVMGSGRDGGRDLYHKGPLIWKGTDSEPGEVWDGYTIFQVKHKERLSDEPAQNAAWLWGQIRKELSDWAEPRKRGKLTPDYLVFITNAFLTPTPVSGGHDFINRHIRDYIDKLRDTRRDLDGGSERRAKLARLSRIRKWRIWDGNQVQAMLDIHRDVRAAFPGFLTAADVLANLAQFTDSLPIEELEPALRAHARTSLTSDGYVYFDEAGSGDGSGIPVQDVVIDLPVTIGDEQASSTVTKYVLGRGEQVLKPRITVHKGPRHLIVAGAPGNGKTTISKFLVQAYRAAMLQNADTLSIHHQRAISETESALHRLGTSLPKHRRWPIRIDLGEYAQERGLDEDSTLVRWIAHKISKRSDLGDVKPWAIVSWLRQWPSFLALDGLDEVTDPAVRKRLIQQVAEFVTDADARNCDVFVILTTRPIGYTEDIAPDQFKRVDLVLQPHLLIA